MAASRQRAEKEKEPRAYRLEIPLDASGVDEFSPDQPLKVAARLPDGSFQEQEVRLDKGGRGTAAFQFDQAPERLHVLVGPADASAEELSHLQTLSIDITRRQWQDRRELVLKPLIISSYYWHWWRIWCRTFVIRGKVVCPDGTPVVGATVCAYDIDWWFFFSSKQQVGCTTTAADGTFTITFRWCCGWWPWWWWRFRTWELDPGLVAQVQPALEKIPNFRLTSPLSNQPSLGIFNSLLGSRAGALSRTLRPEDVNILDALRPELLKQLPALPELERLRIWPWYPWWPWWDCTPDIVFKVSVDCQTPGMVVLDEGIGQTRWNISNPLSVTLVVDPNPCCRGDCPDDDCPGGECLIIDSVCGIQTNQIGGNLGAPAAPVGYALPGAVAPGTPQFNGDRPFSQTISVSKNPGPLVGWDYYEIEVDSGSGWGPLPGGAAQGFVRAWWDGTFHNETFPVITNFPGHEVYEFREHREVAIETLNPGLNFGVNAFWLSNNFSTLFVLDTTKFADGAHRFRAVGWQEAGGNLVNPQVIPVCNTQQDNELVLTFDNRVITPLGHPAGHNCGGVHTCTLEPDTHILSVTVNGNLVGECGTVSDTSGNLEVVFMVHDPDGHLAYYSLIATYGVNNHVDLLGLGVAPVPLAAGTFEGPTYGEALGQGATAPHWHGGTYRLTVPLNQAFPEPCCYQLELRAYKRTLPGCSGSFDHNNLSEFTLGVGVC
jgi:hypothetical protein